MASWPSSGYLSTQAIIALSSGEAEFYALVKCGSVALGIRNMLHDLGVKVKIRISTDASAAKGITARGHGFPRLVTTYFSHDDGDLCVQSHHQRAKRAEYTWDTSDKT